jgi:hypothetical protein
MQELYPQAHVKKHANKDGSQLQTTSFGPFTIDVTGISGSGQGSAVSLGLYQKRKTLKRI